MAELAPEAGWLDVAPSPIEAETSSLETDVHEFDPVAESETQSLLQSLTSSVWAHTYDRGRRYHSYRHGRYPIPNDDAEQTREETKHVMMLELTVCLFRMLLRRRKRQLWARDFC